MRILLIAYHFPPDTAVGALRPGRVARTFAEWGHDVEVITAGPADGMPPTSPGPRITVHAVKPHRSPRERMAAAYQFLRGGGGKGAAAPVATKTVDTAGETLGPVPTWKRWIFALLWLPDDRQGFIKAAAQKARELARAKPFDLVYSSAPPFSVHLAGLRASRDAGVPWAAEFRDPWTDNPWKPASARSAFGDMLDRALERRVLGSASFVVSVSDGIHDILGPRSAQLGRAKALVVRNGIEKLVTPPPRMGGPIRIVYVGSLYYERDPRPFLESLGTLRKSAGPTWDVQVEFYGNCRWFRGQSVEAMVRSLGLEDSVIFHDWVEPTVAERVALEGDILLLLAQKQPMQVPNKLYEYLGTGRPILAFADAGGETARMLRMVGGHFLVISDSPNEATIALEAAILQVRSGHGPTPDQSKLDAWRVERQFAALHQVLGDTA